MEVILRSGHGGEGFADDLLAVDGDEDLAELAIDHRVFAGEERIEGFGDFRADFGIGLAEADQDELQGTQRGQFVTRRCFDGAEGKEHAVFEFGVFRRDIWNGAAGGGFGLFGGFSAFRGI